jgi:hypothetical protein
MPRIGSLTQSPRQPTMFRGASIVPMMRHGMTRLEPMTGGELVGGIDFTRPLAPIAHQGRGLPFLDAPQFTGSFTLVGVSRDNAGAPLGNCTVDLFRSTDNSFLGRTVSDGSGNYSFKLGNNSEPMFVRMYLAGAPDLAGTSQNGLTAVYVAP